MSVGAVSCTFHVILCPALQEPLQFQQCLVVLANGLPVPPAKDLWRTWPWSPYIPPCDAGPMHVCLGRLLTNKYEMQRIWISLVKSSPMLGSGLHWSPWLRVPREAPPSCPVTICNSFQEHKERGISRWAGRLEYEGPAGRLQVPGAADYGSS